MRFITIGHVTQGNEAEGLGMHRKSGKKAEAKPKKTGNFFHHYNFFRFRSQPEDAFISLSKPVIRPVAQPL